MSKKIISLAISALMLVAMAIPASASVFTASAEDKPAAIVTEASGTVGDYVVTTDDIIIVAISETDEFDEEEQEIFDEAVAEVQSVTDVQDLIGDVDDMETPKVAAMYYVSLSEELSEAMAENPDAVISITLASTGVSSDVNVLAFVYKSEAWTQIDATVNDDGTITLTGHFCPIMLVVDAAEDSEDEEVTSPETNDISVNYIGAFAFVFVVATASCMVSVKKSAKTK